MDKEQPGIAAWRGVGLPVVLLLAALAVPLGVGIGCQRPQSSAVAGGAEGFAGEYVGNAACQSCHADLSDAYHASNKGHSIALFNPATAPEVFDAQGRSPVVYNRAFDFYYQAFIRNDTLFQREFRLDAQGDTVHQLTFPASHVIGSGNATRSYLMSVSDGEGGVAVTQMPLTWYAQQRLWDLSPGYTQQNQRFSRPIVQECMTCHNAVSPQVSFTLNVFEEVPLGIACEQCHGPGAAHVAARTANRALPEGQPDPTVVNPARLDVERQLAVCQQCHLEGISVFQPDQGPTTFRPGQLLRANREVYAPEEQLTSPEEFGLASHALRLKQSRCFTATQGTERALTCTTCHDAHHADPPDAEAQYNSVCQSCHGASAHEAACSRPGTATQAEAMGGNCVSCHLQKAGTTDIPHVTFTDHWIRRTLPTPRAGTTRQALESAWVRPTPFRLVNLTAREAAAEGATSPQGQVMEALAYYRLYGADHAHPAYLPRIVDGLRGGLAAGATHPDARLALGRTLLALDSIAQAERVLADAHQRNPAQADVAYWLGQVQLKTGQYEAAITALNAAVRLQPRWVEAHLQRGAALAASGQPQAATVAFRRALALNPVHFPMGWNDLGFELMQQGQAAEARQALARAVHLNPDLVEARVNLGTLDLLENRLEDARRHFEAALRVDPNAPAALGNLGVVYARLGRRADARQQFERLLRNAPRDERARAYLERLNRGEAL